MKSSNQLLEILIPKKVSEYTYIGDHFDIGNVIVFGGQVLAQALAVAYDTVSDSKVLHSIHSYFIHPGDKNTPITYEVEVIKHGRTFDTRRVIAKQHDRHIFILAASFHIKEEGIQHQRPMPNVVQPEMLQDFSQLFVKFCSEHDIEPRGIFSQDGPFMFKPVELYNPFEPTKRPALSNVWFKLNTEKTPTDIVMKQAVTTYASDFNLLVTALLPHGLSFFKSKLLIASLDHAMWFYNEPTLDDWMLYSVESPSAANGRALCQGSIYTRSGELVAKVMQEGLIRQF